MQRIVQHTLEVSVDNNSIVIAETKPVDLGACIASDTTTLRLDIKQAIRLQRLLSEAIATAASEASDLRQASLWSPATFPERRVS